MNFPKTWLIADTHFGHKAICDYESRPFKSAKEMDESLIANWNNTVSKQDTIYVLGDFSFHGTDETQNIIKRLTGNKILVMGNHDSRSVNWWINAGFKEVYKHPVIVDEFFILSHEPMYVNTNMPYANIFGHVHNRPEYHKHTAQTFCVCVERINYMPIDFDEVKAVMQGHGGSSLELSEFLDIKKADRMKRKEAGKK